MAVELEAGSIFAGLNICENHRVNNTAVATAVVSDG
jgi:hypothetical protein